MASRYYIVDWGASWSDSDIDGLAPLNPIMTIDPVDRDKHVTKSVDGSKAVLEFEDVAGLTASLTAKLPTGVTIVYEGDHPQIRAWLVSNANDWNS